MIETEKAETVSYTSLYNRIETLSRCHYLTLSLSLSRSHPLSLTRSLSAASGVTRLRFTQRAFSLDVGPCSGYLFRTTRAGVGLGISN